VSTPAAPSAQSEHPQIDCGGGHGPEVIRGVQDALCEGKIPFTYVADGRAVAVQAVTGSPDADGSRPLPVAVTALEPALLKSMLARFTFTFRWVPPKVPGGDSEQVEISPEAGLLASALAPRSWPGLSPLTGVIGAPVLRPDGTLLTKPGYDEASGLFLANRVHLPEIPQRPPADWVAAARDLLFRCVLGDFCWCGPADKANFTAMLVTQVIRRLLRGAPVPFFPVTATDQASGKTLLAAICGALFGQAKIIWTDDEEELRKQLTTVMRSQEGVITFDNLPEGTVIRSGVLAKLLTDRTWGDRLLGGNVLAKFANDRLWCATGNNIRLGGDMRSRSVLTGLDARMPHPERRTGFAIGDLESWIEDPANQREMLTALLVLVADWAAAGCPQADVLPMRQFSTWARMAGGFLARHQDASWLNAGAFLANAGELESADDDDADWAQFLARWAAIWGPGVLVTSEQVLATGWDQRWGGTFPTGKGGAALSVRSLGRRLAGARGRYHGEFVLRGWQDNHRLWWWRVEQWVPSMPSLTSQNTPMSPG